MTVQYATVKIEAAIEMKGIADDLPSLPKYAYVCIMTAGMAWATLKENTRSDTKEEEEGS